LTRAPAKTAPEIIRRLNSEIRTIVQDKTHRERMIGGDFEPTTSTPEEFTAFIKRETEKWGKVIKISGARAE
jgi:tripartite-type tricarboxylate transporter receptor subunit TctC